MKKCIVIGGGLAGLTAAAYLADSGFLVEVIEASPKLGGRAYSFKDNQTGSIVDNGQHIMMGCYRETLKYFKLIGADENLIYQKRLKVNFLKENFQIFTLTTLPLPYPFNLLSALLRYNVLSISERVIFLKFFLKLPFVSLKSLQNLSVYDWLVRENQNKRIRKAFWEILAVGALNSNIKKASASSFAFILREIFLAGSKASTIIIPRLGLSETYCQDSVRFLASKGGKVTLLESIERFNIKDNRVTGLETSKRKITDFDFVISAVPNFSLEKILPEIDFTDRLKLNYSSIISIHLWLKDNFFKENFYGLIDSPVHWIFNHKDHITLVISDANELAEKSKDELFNLAVYELEKFTKIKKEKIISYKIIKEKRATFVPSNDIISFRPKSETKFKNLFLAGDWIDTGLPSTIESAVKSGRIASESVILSAKSK